MTTTTHSLCDGEKPNPWRPGPIKTNTIPQFSGWPNTSGWPTIRRCIWHSSIFWFQLKQHWRWWPVGAGDSDSFHFISINYLIWNKLFKSSCTFTKKRHWTIPGGCFSHHTCTPFPIKKFGETSQGSSLRCWKNSFSNRNMSCLNPVYDRSANKKNGLNLEIIWYDMTW